MIRGSIVSIWALCSNYLNSIRWHIRWARPWPRPPSIKTSMYRHTWIVHLRYFSVLLYRTRSASRINMSPIFSLSIVFGIPCLQVQQPAYHLAVKFLVIMNFQRNNSRNWGFLWFEVNFCLLSSILYWPPGSDFRQCWTSSQPPRRIKHGNQICLRRLLSQDVLADAPRSVCQWIPFNTGTVQTYIDDILGSHAKIWGGGKSREI